MADVEITKKQMEFLAFLQEQMECRRSPDPDRIGYDERSTTEYQMLNMCWNEFLSISFALFPVLDMEKCRGIHEKVKKFREGDYDATTDD